MGARKVMVRVIAEYEVDVIANSGPEAQEKAEMRVRLGLANPYSIDSIIENVTLCDEKIMEE